MERATELPVIDIDEVRHVMEGYAERGWTDGLPVMPVTESYLAEFLRWSTARSGSGSASTARGMCSGRAFAPTRRSAARSA